LVSKLRDFITDIARRISVGYHVVASFHMVAANPRIFIFGNKKINGCETAWGIPNLNLPKGALHMARIANLKLEPPKRLAPHGKNCKSET